MAYRMRQEPGFGLEDVEDDEQLEWVEDFGEADDEADDEAFEAFEVYDEALETDDEGFETDDEGSETDDEAFETDDEASVYGSARGPGPSREAQLRATRDRQTAAARARGLAADQRAATQRASAAQRALDQRLRRIGVPSRVGVSPIGTVKGQGIVTATLPNGRTTRMMFTPPLATRTDVNVLMRRIAVNDQRQAKAIAAQGKAVQELKAAQSAAVKSLTAQQLKLGQDLSKRVATGEAKLDKRITAELLGQKSALAKQRSEFSRALRQQKQRATWNAVLLGSALPLYAAYGERSDPFSRTNLILTGSLAFWLMGDDLIGNFLRGDGKGRGSRLVRSGVSTWSYLAPIGNWATVWYLLSGLQHERFVAGTEPEVGTAPKEVTIGVKIGKDSLSDFVARDDVIALATIVGGSKTGTTGTTATATGVRAEVKGGKLILTLLGGSAGETATVAWAVDTKKP